MRGHAQPLWLLATVVALAAGCSSPDAGAPIQEGSSSGGSSGLSRADAGAAALGSVVGGVNVFVSVWILLESAPARV